MTRLKAVVEILVLALLGAGLGYTLGLFSGVGVPEGAMVGRPLQRAGSGSFLAAGLAGSIAAWLMPRLFLVWPFAVAAGFASLAAYRVSVHMPDLAGSPYVLALVLSLPCFAGALIGSIAGVLASQLLGKPAVPAGEAQALERIDKLTTAGKWIALCGVLIPFVLLPFANPHDLSLPALLAAVLTPLLLFSGLILYAIGRVRGREAASKKDDARRPDNRSGAR